MFNLPKKSLKELPAEVQASAQTNIQQAAEVQHEDAGQIQFYIYDRGQGFNKDEEVVMAQVNNRGSAAHYVFSSRDKTWRFFQLPHLCTEKRASERMGFASIAAMHEHLFGLFNQHLETIGWNARHAPVFFAA